MEKTKRFPLSGLLIASLPFSPQMSKKNISTAESDVKNQDDYP